MTRKVKGREGWIRGMEEDAKRLQQKRGKQMPHLKKGTKGKSHGARPSSHSLSRIMARARVLQKNGKGKSTAMKQAWKEHRGGK